MEIKNPYAYAAGMLEVWVERAAEQLERNPTDALLAAELRAALARVRRVIKTGETV